MLQQGQQQNGIANGQAGGPNGAAGNRRPGTPNGTAPGTPGPADVPNGQAFPAAIPFYDPSGIVRLAAPAGVATAAAAGQGVPPGVRLLAPGAAGAAPLLINNGQGLAGGAAGAAAAPGGFNSLNLTQQNSLGSIGSPTISLPGMSL